MTQQKITLVQGYLEKFRIVNVVGRDIYKEKKMIESVFVNNVILCSINEPNSEFFQIDSYTFHFSQFPKTFLSKNIYLKSLKIFC